MILAAAAAAAAADSSPSQDLDRWCPGTDQGTDPGPRLGADMAARGVD